MIHIVCTCKSETWAGGDTAERMAELFEHDHQGDGHQTTRKPVRARRAVPSVLDVGQREGRRDVDVIDPGEVL